MPISIIEKRQFRSVTLFGDSGCFLPLYVAPFTEIQMERIRRYQQHPDYIGVVCHTCIRKEKMIPQTEGMRCPNCGVIYAWGYGLLTREEAEVEAASKKKTAGAAACTDDATPFTTDATLGR